MWKPFRQSTQRNAPHAAILFDKFHILRHLGEALDKIRKAEYGRVTGPQRKFIKGQKYVLLSHKENLTNEGRKGLRPTEGQQALEYGLYPSGVIRSAVGLAQIGGLGIVASLKTGKHNCAGQCLKPYEKFAEMIERHWDGIAAYCRPENKIALGFVEGLNNKIRVLQRRAYGLRDEEYLKLKILTASLPEL